MFPQSVTLYHRTTSGEREAWAPVVISGVNCVGITREDPSDRTAASVSGTVNVRYMLSVPLARWPEEAAPGDWVLNGTDGPAAFEGSGAETLQPLGGRVIEEILTFAFGSRLDHVQAVLR